MFDRFKKSTAGDDRRPAESEAPAAAAPSGFGRRQAPVAQSAAAPSGNAQRPPSNAGPTDLTRPILD